jgi:hypothetical protein
LKTSNKKFKKTFGLYREKFRQKQSDIQGEKVKEEDGEH